MAQTCYSQNQDDFGPLSPQKAQNLSLYTTLGAVSMGTLSLLIFGGDDEDGEAPVGQLMFLTGWFGLMFCPGTGYLYAHHPWGFWRGALIRIAGTGATLLSLALTWDDPEASGGWELFLGGMAIVLGSAIYDITQVDDCAQKYNQRLTRGSISLTPHFFAKYKAPGIKLSINF